MCLALLQGPGECSGVGAVDACPHLMDGRTLYLCSLSSLSFHKTLPISELAEDNIQEQYLWIQTA